MGHFLRLPVQASTHAADIDNMIVDQYLLQLKLPIEAKEVDELINKIRKEVQDEKKDFADELKKLNSTMAKSNASG